MFPLFKPGVGQNRASNALPIVRDSALRDFSGPFNFILSQSSLKMKQCKPQTANQMSAFDLTNCFTLIWPSWLTGHYISSNKLCMQSFDPSFCSSCSQWNLGYHPCKKSEMEGPAATVLMISLPHGKTITTCSKYMPKRESLTASEKIIAIMNSFQPFIPKWALSIAEQEANCSLLPVGAI